MLDKILTRSMVMSAIFTPFLWTGVIFTIFTNVRKVMLIMNLLKFEVRISEKITEFFLKLLSQVWGHFSHLKAFWK